MTAERESGLTRVEIQLTHLAHDHEQLDAVVVDQARAIAALERLVRDLKRRVDRLERGDDAPGADGLAPDGGPGGEDEAEG